jgi:hypothetical protein
VAATIYLGTERYEVSTIQHYYLDLLLHREIFRPLIWPSSLIVVSQLLGTTAHVVEKEKIV